MATEDKFIVAIELGSSKVTGIAGRKQPDGVIQILAFAQEPSTTFIRKGRINNVNKMTQSLLNIKEKLEQKLQSTISRVYVGIGGMGMHTVANTVVRHFNAKIEVTQEMVDSMCDENRTTTNGDREILESVPQEYRLGTQLQTDPVGILAESIEGHYLNIVASSSIREEIRNCFRNASIQIADLPITVQALADNMLTEPEKRSGCVFVDMGAETTSVAVYKNNLLRHLAVIPLGGANVNRDIMSLQIEDDEAEELKLKYGSAIANTEENGSKTIQLRDGRQIKYDEFSGLVEARVEEIILNIQNQITLSSYDKSQLIGGLIITGGASHMKDIDKAFTRDTNFDKIRFVHNIRIPIRSTDYDNFNADGQCNAALALVDKGEINCNGGAITQPEEEEIQQEKVKEPTQDTTTAETETTTAPPSAVTSGEQQTVATVTNDSQQNTAKNDNEEKSKKDPKVKNVFNKFVSWLSNLVSEKDN